MFKDILDWLKRFTSIRVNRIEVLEVISPTREIIWWSDDNILKENTLGWDYTNSIGRFNVVNVHLTRYGITRGSVLSSQTVLECCDEYGTPDALKLLKHINY